LEQDYADVHADVQDSEMLREQVADLTQQLSLAKMELVELQTSAEASVGGRGRTESVSELKSEIARLRRAKDDADEERKMLVMSLDAYKARVNDLEGK